ncbi:3-oxoadipate enol-lactonase [Bradyrhizobium sp. 190]|uniref:3-oxoadipate enol-lactonase n=1 Tax=Bradyrhizobium sp. 190 TaxID=2782658 RepID=UPI001FFA2311|nr:3-oxoadipate enol-lactonase [Bradyrhizobium sp. 190]MCK1513158.1 3-oxoadipate enol-lactonase [Bradyrhizobium sp. 190]
MRLGLSRRDDAVSKTIVADDGCSLRVEVEGDEAAPVLMLSHPLGATLAMWDLQVEELSKIFRVIRYDTRGHGKSGAPSDPYSMDRLGRDVLNIVDALGVGVMHWCGLSMGGMVGQWLGANAPGRVRKLILSNTASYYPDKDFWRQRIATIERTGLAPLAASNMPRWFSEEFLAHSPDVVSRMREIFSSHSVKGYVGCCAAIAAMDFRKSNESITAPTMVIVGLRDIATPPEQGHEIATSIRGATVTEINSGHVANIEQPKQYTDAVSSFLLS